MPVQIPQVEAKLLQKTSSEDRAALQTLLSGDSFCSFVGEDRMDSIVLEGLGFDSGPGVGNACMAIAIAIICTPL